MTDARPTDRPAGSPTGDAIDAMATAAFSAPWEVRALALVLSLQRQGVLGRTEWADALGTELRRAHDAGLPDSPRRYYGCVLHALQDRLCAHGMADPARIDRVRIGWQRAVRRTPHGQPLELRAEDLA